MHATGARFRLFGTKPVHLAAAALVSAASCFQEYRQSVTAASVAKTLDCCAKSIKRVVNIIPHYELQFTGPIADVEHRWLVRRGGRQQQQQTVNVKPSCVSVVVPSSSGGSDDTGIRLKFKSKRQRIAEEKRRAIAEKVRQHAQQQQQQQQRSKHGSSSSGRDSDAA